MSANKTPPTASDTVRIAIVGGSVTAAAAMESILDKFNQQRPSRPTEIHIFDPRGRFAAGDAFGTTSESAKLNTDPDKMGPLNNPRDFPRSRPDEVPAQPGTPMERRSFGEYTRARMDKVIRLLAELGVTVRFFAEEITVVHLQRADNTSGYVLESIHGRHHADVVVIATGRVSSSGPPEIAGRASCIANPWAPGALDAIARGNRVLVLGTSLTTVDIVGRLDANGHQGSITAIARTRGLPTVQNLGNPYSPSVFTHPMVQALSAYGTRRLTMDDVLGSLRAELRRAGVADTDEGVDAEIREQIDLARSNPHAALLKNIAEAEAGRAVVSAVIGALNDATRFAWPLVSDEDALRLLRYKSLYSMFANAMPLANARMMERVMAKGLLRVHVGLTAVTHNAAAGHYIATTTHPHGHTLHHEADTVIVATGNTRRLADAGPLIRQMRADGIIREHPRGGVDITPAGRVIHADGTPASGLWWIGEATEGARLGTNCVRVIKHHSRATIEDLTGQIYA